MTLNLMGAICLTERSLMVGLVPGISFGIVVDLFFTLADVVNMGIEVTGTFIDARLECPITLILKSGVGIRLEVDLVLAPPVVGGVFYAEITARMACVECRSAAVGRRSGPWTASRGVRSCCSMSMQGQTASCSITSTFLSAFSGPTPPSSS